MYICIWLDKIESNTFSAVGGSCQISNVSLLLSFHHVPVHAIQNTRGGGVGCFDGGVWVCCSVLQCVAVCCGVLRCAALMAECLPLLPLQMTWGVAGSGLHCEMQSCRAMKLHENFDTPSKHGVSLLWPPVGTNEGEFTQSMPPSCASAMNMYAHICIGMYEHIIPSWRCVWKASRRFERKCCSWILWMKVSAHSLTIDIIRRKKRARTYLVITYIRGKRPTQEKLKRVSATSNLRDTYTFTTNSHTHPIWWRGACPKNKIFALWKPTHINNNAHSHAHTHVCTHKCIDEKSHK